MDNIVDHKYFLLVGSKKISLGALDSKNRIFFNKEILINDLSIKEIFSSLENFLDKNIFEIEKDLKSYIKEIILIVDFNDFLKVDMSFSYNFKKKDFSSIDLTNALIDIKNNFKKTIIDYEIIHMVINKFIIDEKVYSFIPNDIDFNNLSLELKFICLKNDFVQNFKKILSKYEISLNRTLCFSYIADFKCSNDENIFSITKKVLNGLNQNEIFLIEKSNKNEGFFEKFFNFFN
jgi:hypothetical protein